MSQENVVTRASGYLMLVVAVALLAASLWSFISGGMAEDPARIIGGVVGLLFFVLCLIGFFVVNPNTSRVLVLFGKYQGTVKENGFYWTNPFNTKQKVSLRALTHNGEKLKVNDLSGNPIEIAAVVVWQVRNTAAAVFDVDDYEDYVETQSESAVRKLASAYAYDGEDDEMTLRGDTEKINEHLRTELEERFQRAGIHVLEARITHLAYAPEIAQAMLQRQQASALIAARTKIVEGAVSMVQMALDELGSKDIVHLDDERRAAMVSNLLTVLCSERTTPVINTGTLYT